MIRDPATGDVRVTDGDLSPVRTDRITAVLGDDVEGPADSTKGPAPYFPFLVIDPVADASGRNQQYIAFLQQNRTGGQVRERIALIPRDMDHKWAWKSPIVVPPTSPGVPPAWVPDANGYATVSADQLNFWRPTAAISPLTHQLAIAFPRLSLAQDIATRFVHNDPFIGSNVTDQRRRDDSRGEPSVRTTAAISRGRL